MSNKTVILFSGFNQRANIAFLRTLEKNNVSYAIIAKSDDDSIFDTEYHKKVLAIRKTERLDSDDLLTSIKEVKNKLKIEEEVIISPSTEALNRFLLSERALFEKQKITIPLVNQLLYEEISDKYSFGEMCKKHQILIPEKATKIEGVKIPFVSKPYSYYTKNMEIHSPQLVLNQEDKKLFETKYNQEDFYYQKYIDGRSHYLLYYFDKNEGVYKYSQENIAQQPEGKSIVAAIPSTIHNTDISTKFENMLKEIGFRGLIMIELKGDGELYMIEANPRFWGPSQFFIDSNMNFFEAFLYDYGVINQPPDFSNPQKSKYFWYGGIKSTLSESKKIVCHSEKHARFLEEEFSEWLENDIFKRKDTLNIFKKETS